MAPWAHALFMRRQLEFGKDSMETQCLPLGPAYLTTRYRDFRIVQTPALIMFAFNDGMHRQIFMDGRALEPDPNPGRHESVVRLRRKGQGTPDRALADALFMVGEHRGILGGHR